MAQPRENWPTLRKLVRATLWAGVTIAAAGAALYSAVSPLGLQRFAQLGEQAAQSAAFPHASGTARRGAPQDMRQVAMLERQVAQLAGLVEQLRQHSFDQDQSQGTVQQRLAAIEDSFGTITGSLPSGKDEDRVPRRNLSSGFTPQTRLATPPSPPDIRPMPADPAANAGPEPRVLRTRFAVELASGQDITRLERIWAVARDAGGAAVAGLEARVRLDRSANGNTLALIAGPIDNAGDAADICGALKVIAPDCKTVPFAGQMLVLGEERQSR